MKIGKKYKEMRKFLANKYRGLEEVKEQCFKFDCQIAIHYYCNENYNSQWDILYQIQCLIRYKPSILNKKGIKGEDLLVNMMYKDLIDYMKEGENH